MSEPKPKVIVFSIYYGKVSMIRPPYPAANSVVMKTEAYKHYIEILPAALLSQRRAWQPITRTLPAGSCLLITDPNNKEQTKFMQTLTQSFRAKRRRVVVWTVGRSTP